MKKEKNQKHKHIHSKERNVSQGWKDILNCH